MKRDSPRSTRRAQRRERRCHQNTRRNAPRDTRFTISKGCHASSQSVKHENAHRFCSCFGRPGAGRSMAPLALSYKPPHTHRFSRTPKKGEPHVGGLEPNQLPLIYIFSRGCRSRSHFTPGFRQHQRGLIGELMTSRFLGFGLSRPLKNLFFACGFCSLTSLAIVKTALTND